MLKALEIDESIVEDLEKGLASFLGYAHVIAVESEAVAFMTCLDPFKKEDEVFCSPFAPLALHRTLYKASLKPKYTDSKLDGTTETRFLERQLSEKSRCFVLSHYEGIYSSVENVQKFCHQNKIFFIEDATQSFPQYKKSAAQVLVFSLSGLIGSAIAQGAFIATDDDSLAVAFRLKAQGGYRKRKNWNYELVNNDENVQLSALAAYFALQHLDALNLKKKKRETVYTLYREALSEVKLLSLPSQKNLSTLNHFPVFLDPALFCPKEDIYNALLEKGIAVEVGLKPVYKTAAFLDASVQLFGADEIYKGVLLLPLSSEMTEDEVLNVVSIFKTILEQFAYRGCSF